MSRGLRLALTVAVGCAAIAALAVFGLKSSGSSKQGRKAPALPREHLAGPAVTLPSLLASAHGRPALVVFWASWCEPCIREAPAFERLAQSPEGKGRMVGVDWSDARSGATAFIRRFGWTFPILRDDSGLVGNSYEIANLPTTFVLDGKGRIVRTLRGPQTEASLRQALQTAESA
jgi:cytochrome c biogenesis protein CcmG, thiol:disulfide interchange protein DsbE